VQVAAAVLVCGSHTWTRFKKITMMQLVLLFFLSSPYGGVVLPSNEMHSDFALCPAVEEPLKTTFQVLTIHALVSGALH
jgi:hypothetical protein